MLVKLFWKNEPMKSGGFLGSGPTGKNAQDFEAEINDWLQDNPTIKIMDIRQSASGGSYFGSLWLISVWYEEGAELSAAPDHGPFSGSQGIQSSEGRGR
jgi:hypothetical protein